MAPFPVYDTGNIEELKKLIEMAENDKTNIYDELPVVCCKYCLDLFVIEDEAGNDICGRCGAVNDIIIFNNIEEYLKEKEKINNSV